MVKTLKKGFLAVVLAVVALFTLASCVINGNQNQNPTPEKDPTQEAQAALNEFTANVTFANAEAITTSFNLPIAGKKAGFDIPIAWSSSNEEVIAIADLMENGTASAYYKQAKVTRPAFDKEDATVTLTADFSLTYKNAEGKDATLKTQKTYTFVVLKETSEIASGNLAAIKAAAGKFYFEENGVAAGSSSPKELAFPVEFDATVTAVLGADGAGQFTVSDGSAGIYVYSNKTAVKVGDKVHVKGDITTYYGTLQVGANIEVTVLGASDQTIEFKPATPGEINAMPTADGMYGGQTIKATGTLLFGKYNGGSSDSFWLEDVQTGSQIELYYKSFTAAEKEALQAFAGKFVEIDVVTYDTYASSKPNDHRVFAIPSTCKEATAPEVSDADKLAAAVNKVKAVQLAALYVDGQEFAFPAVDGGEGVTITWAIDPAAVLVDGKLVVAENGTAKLIATVKVGELSETVELTINLAKEAKEEPAVTNKTVAELIALTTEMDAKYTVSGKVVKWGNKLDSTDTAATMYGNFILEDAEGQQIIVYGATATASALTFDAATGKYTYKNAKDFLTDALTKDIAVGDTVKLTVVRTSYNGNPQLNAIVVSVTKPGETELPTEGVVTLAQAIEIANKQAHNTYTTGKFTVTGKVSDLYNTVYGNMHLLDEAGNDLTIYGLYIEGQKYGDYTGTKPVVGDVITVTGILGTYNGKPQMKNADLVIETKPEEPKHEHVACPTCGKCTAADCDGAAEDKCAGHSSTPEVPSENKTVSVVIKDYAAANSWANGTMYNNLVMDSNVTVTMAAAGGNGSYAANTGKYYTSGFEWRAYQSDKEATIVVTAAEGLNIATVKITYVTKNGGILVCNGANVESAAVVTVNAASATFTIANTGTATNGQIKVTAIEVVYGSGSGSAPEQPEEPKHEHVACPTCGKCTAADCDGAAEDKCAGHTVEPEQPELPTEGVVTLAQAIEIANKQAHNTYTTGKFTVTGKVSDLYNTVYGNMHLLDDAGNDLTIYGLYIEGSKYGDYTGTKPVEGDVITVTGILGTYNGKPQMKNADLVIETKPEEHKHTEEVLAAKDATCTEKGLTEGKKCSVCGEILVAQTEVAAKGHKEEVLAAKEATCTEKGLTEGKKCSVCGETLVAQTEVAAKGHKEEVLAAKDATCTEKGLTEGKKCSVCGETLVAQTEVAEKGHNFAEGKCTVCGADDPDYVAPEQPGTTIEPVAVLETNGNSNFWGAYTNTVFLNDGKLITNAQFALRIEITKEADGTLKVTQVVESGVKEFTFAGTYGIVISESHADWKTLSAKGYAVGQYVVIEGDTTTGVATVKFYAEKPNQGEAPAPEKPDMTLVDEFAAKIVADFNATGASDAKVTTREDFKATTHPNIKYVFNNAEKLAEYKWFFEFALAEMTNAATASGSLSEDTFLNTKELLEKMIAGDTTAVGGDYANGRTAFRWWIQGVINGTLPPAEKNVYDMFMVDYSVAENLNRFIEAYQNSKQAPAPHVHTEETLAAKEATCTEKGLTEGKKCSTCGEILVAQEEVAEKGHSFAEGKCTVCGADDPDYVAPEQPAEPVTVTLNVKEAAAANGWTSSANNLKNAYAIDENISISVAGGSNSGKFYTDHLRIYATDSPAGSITLTAKEGYKIKSVSFKLVTGTYAFLQLDGATITNGQVVELDASTVKFNTVKNGSDGKQVRVIAVTVTYVAE